MFCPASFSSALRAFPFAEILKRPTEKLAVEVLYAVQYVETVMPSIGHSGSALGHRKSGFVYRLVLDLWDMLCRAFPSLPVYVTARPPVDHVDCQYLCDKDDSNRIRYNLQLTAGFSLQSCVSLLNMLWAGGHRIQTNGSNAYPFVADGETKIKDYRTSCREETSAPDWTAGNPKDLSALARYGIESIALRDDPDDRHLKYFEGTIGGLSPLFLTMFLAKGMTYVKRPKDYKLKGTSMEAGGHTAVFDVNRSTAMPYLFCQPTCNIRGYTYSNLKQKVLDGIKTNLEQPDAGHDAFRSATLYCMMYREELCGAEDLADDDNLLSVRPVQDLIRGAVGLKQKFVSTAAPVTTEDVEILIDLFRVPKDLLKASLSSKAYKSLMQSMKAYPEESRKYLEARAGACWRFAFVMSYICKAFDGFSTLSQIFRFRGVLVRRLGLERLDPPYNVPDLLEECRTMLHAITPCRIGLVEGLGRMLIAFYTSRFMYPEDTDSTLVDRCLRTSEDALKSVLPAEWLGIQARKDYTSYLSSVSHQATKTVFLFPASFTEEGDLPDHKDRFFKRDLTVMDHVSQKHQNIADKTETAAMRDILKRYFTYIVSGKNIGTVAKYVYRPPPLAENGVQGSSTDSKQHTRKQESLWRYSHAMRSGSLIQFLAKNGPSVLKTWIVNFGSAYGGAVSANHKMMFGYDVGQTSDGATALHLAYMRLSHITKNGSGPFFERWTPPDKSTTDAPRQTWEILGMLTLALDYYYDNATLQTLGNMLSQDCKPSMSGTTFLKAHIADGLFKVPSTEIGFPAAGTVSAVSQGDVLETWSIFPSTKEPFSSAGMRSMTTMFLNHLHKPALSLLYGLEQDYVFSRCFDLTGHLVVHPEENPTKDHVTRYTKLGKVRNELNYKLFVNLTTAIVDAIATFGMLLPYWKESAKIKFASVANVAVKVEQPEKETPGKDVPPKATSDDESGDDDDDGAPPEEPVADTAANVFAQGEEVVGLELALSPTAWLAVSGVDQPSPVLDNTGANIQGMIALIVFLITRQRHVLCVDHWNLYKNVDVNGIATVHADDKNWYDEPKNWPVRFLFFVDRGNYQPNSQEDGEGLRYPRSYTLAEVISILLTNRVYGNDEVEPLLQEEDRAALQNAMDKFTFRHYEKAFVNPKGFAHVDLSGRSLDLSRGKVTTWGSLPKAVLQGYCTVPEDAIVYSSPPKKNQKKFKPVGTSEGGMEWVALEGAGRRNSTSTSKKTKKAAEKSGTDADISGDTPAKNKDTNDDNPGDTPADGLDPKTKEAPDKEGTTSTEPAKTNGAVTTTKTTTLTKVTTSVTTTGNGDTATPGEQTIDADDADTSVFSLADTPAATTNGGDGKDTTTKGKETDASVKAPGTGKSTPGETEWTTEQVHEHQWNLVRAMWNTRLTRPPKEVGKPFQMTLFGARSLKEAEVDNRVKAFLAKHKFTKLATDVLRQVCSMLEDLVKARTIEWTTRHDKNYQQIVSVTSAENDCPLDKWPWVPQFVLSCLHRYNSAKYAVCANRLYSMDSMGLSFLNDNSLSNKMEFAEKYFDFKEMRPPNEPYNAMWCDAVISVCRTMLTALSGRCRSVCKMRDQAGCWDRINAQVPRVDVAQDSARWNKEHCNPGVLFKLYACAAAPTRHGNGLHGTVWFGDHAARVMLGANLLTWDMDPLFECTQNFFQEYHKEVILKGKASIYGLRGPPEPGASRGLKRTLEDAFEASGDNKAEIEIDDDDDDDDDDGQEEYSPESMTTPKGDHFKVIVCSSRTRENPAKRIRYDSGYSETTTPSVPARKKGKKTTSKKKKAGPKGGKGSAGKKK